MENFIVEALREAILTEKSSFEFYRCAAETVADERTRQVFELLAMEEIEHANAFLRLYSGKEFDDLPGLMKKPYDRDDPVNRELLEAVDADMTEENALKISLREEQSCIDRYTALVATIRDPKVSEVFAKALSETRKHYEVIQEEYMRVMTMVDRSDQDIYVRE